MQLSDSRRVPWSWGAIALGLLLMYVPSYVALGINFWHSDHGSHGPVMLVLVLWLVWRERAAFREQTSPDWRSRIAGASLLVLGAVAYVVGRSQDFYQLDQISQVPVLGGILLLMLGARGLRRFWFPLFLLLFIVPIPGSMLEQLLLPLKQAVSAIVDGGLFLLGYPIARNGVVLTIGSYDLLIADACSGLNSMIALTGAGLFYVYMARNSSIWGRLLLLASVLPIAFVTNIVRVTVLVLVTYHFGDAAGQGFHDHAAILEVLVALLAFFVVDFLLARRIRPTRWPALPEAGVPA